MKNVTIFELAWELLSAGVKVEEVAKRLGKHRVTIYRWKKGIRYQGIRRFVKEKKEAKRKRKRRCLSSTIEVSRASVYRVLNRYHV